jgi:predicted nucleotidyltransferase
MSISDIQQAMAPVFMKYPIRYAGIFGSYAKNTQSAQSDIDILVGYQPSFSFFDLVSLQEELAIVTNKKVDLVTEKSLSPFIKDSIMKDLTLIYER